MKADFISHCTIQTPSLSFVVWYHFAILSTKFSAYSRGKDFYIAPSLFKFSFAHVSSLSVCFSNNNCLT